MGKRLYVGNLAYSLRSSDLEEAFKKIGEVVSAKVIMERDSGRSKGFAFVEMASDELGEMAINQMNGIELAGRPIRVTEANPKPQNSEHGDRPPRRDRGFNDRRGGGFRGRNSGRFGGES